jgi:hypothetical protein
VLQGFRIIYAIDQFFYMQLLLFGKVVFTYPFHSLEQDRERFVAESKVRRGYVLEQDGLIANR